MGDRCVGFAAMPQWRNGWYVERNMEDLCIVRRI